MRFAILLRGLATALALLGSAGAARAQSLAIEPVVVQLSPGQLAGTLTILNQSEAQSAFQVRAFAWSNSGGEDTLTPTDDIVVSPPLGTVGANQRQLIRIVLRQAPRDKEATYRVWIDQIPTATEANGVRIALRLSIPIFAAPATRTAPDLHWQLSRQGQSLVVTATNRGTRHQAVRNLTFTDSAGAPLKLEGNPSPYILPGATRRWIVAAPAATAGVRLTAASNDGPLDLTLSPQP